MVDPFSSVPEQQPEETLDGVSQEASLKAQGWYHRPQGPAVHMPMLEKGLRKWESETRHKHEAQTPEAMLYDPSMMAPLEEMTDDGLAEMATMSAGVGASTGLYVLLGDLWRSSLPNHAGGAFPEIKKLSC